MCSCLFDRDRRALMTTLFIPSRELAEQMEGDLEGRLEVMRDDGLQHKPDYVDADAVAQLVREQTAFPATVEVSDAEAVQAYITLENMLDLDASEADYTAAIEHLTAQGYPH